jgi:hypothetical protein
MFERSLSRQDVATAIRDGEVIVDYPDDSPHPSYLVLGFVDQRPVHVVVAQDQARSHCIVVTTYIPDPALWTDGFRKRKS